MKPTSSNFKCILLINLDAIKRAIQITFIAFVLECLRLIAYKNIFYKVFIYIRFIVYYCMFILEYIIHVINYCLHFCYLVCLSILIYLTHLCLKELRIWHGKRKKKSLFSCFQQNSFLILQHYKLLRNH